MDVEEQEINHTENGPESAIAESSPAINPVKIKKTALKLSTNDVSAISAVSDELASQSASGTKTKKAAGKGSASSNGPSAASEDKIRKKYRDYKRRLDSLEHDNADMVRKLTFLRQTARKLMLERSFIFQKLEEFQASDATVNINEIPLLKAEAIAVGQTDGSNADDLVSMVLDAGGGEGVVPIAKIVSQFVQASSTSTMGPFSSAKKAEKITKRRNSKNEEGGKKTAASQKQSTAAAKAAKAKAADSATEPSETTLSAIPATKLADIFHAEEDDFDEESESAFPDAVNGSASHDEETEPGTKKRKKTKKRPVDPNIPKRPNNAFLNFCSDVREKVKEEMRLSGANVNQQPGDITKLLAEKWRSLEAEKKVYYQDKAEAALRKWQQEVSALRASGIITSSPNRPPSSTSGTPPAIKAEDDAVSSYSVLSEPESVPQPTHSGVSVHISTVPALHNPSSPSDPMSQSRPARFVSSVSRIHDFISAPAPPKPSEPVLAPTIVIKPAHNTGGVFNPHNLVAVPAVPPVTTVPVQPPAFSIPARQPPMEAIPYLQNPSAPNIAGNGLLNLANAAVMEDTKLEDAEEYSSPSDDDGDSGPPDVNAFPENASNIDTEVLDMED